MKQNIKEYFKTEVYPFVPDAWYDTKNAKIGYEIPFTKYFYKHTALRDMSSIVKDIKKLEEETEGLLKEIID